MHPISPFRRTSAAFRHARKPQDRSLDLVRAFRPGGWQRILWMETRSATYKPDCHDPSRSDTAAHRCGRKHYTVNPNRRDHASAGNFASAGRGTARAAPVHAMSARKASDRRRTFRALRIWQRIPLNGDAIIHARAPSGAPLSPGKIGHVGVRKRGSVPS